MNGLNLLDYLTIINDPRQQWKVEHKLSDILFLVIVAVIGGAEGWEEIEDFGVDHLEWLQQYGDFENGIPVHDTIARVMSMISAKQLQKSFAAWMRDCHIATEGEVIAIDGKSLRGTYSKDRRNGIIHMVSAFSAANKVVLGQVKTAEKSNEITAIPELLELLNIRGCLITIDAMGCQKAIARKVVSKEADYLLSVKSNQPSLEAAFDNYFKLEMLQREDGDTYSTKEQGHGRVETRLCLVNDDLSVLGDIAFEWPELKTIGIVATIRQEKGQPATGITLRYYISSAQLTSKELLEASRTHWSIESQLHWRLDVGMREDECRIRREQAGENFAAIRHIALNLLSADTSFKAGIKRKQKRAGRNNEYLSRLLAGQGLS
ncbi:ISAs1 family transposase [Oceanisphaera pacifica]|uniref:ISAs1 family transposase n=1 Tax=Oceanisphaera pacifica TaxID=2818389 RepID=A0ABS3NHW1_9GAMM|nr:ISAs1 family transposase [Oceanisphaera pacifica]MBO1520183.1 ISAs1 family transposase [Oceanisphaera pacifica]